MRGLQRRHDIAEAQEAITLVPNVFDILYMDPGDVNRSTVHGPHKRLVEMVTRQYVAPQVVSADTGSSGGAYRDALAAATRSQGAGFALHPPGQRGKNSIEIKPEVDTLNLAVIGAECGEGKRAHVFG